MNTKGTIIRTSNNLATVIVARQSSCGGNCAMCEACPNKKIEIEVINNCDAKINDVVTISTKSSLVLLTSFLIYIMPIILFLATVLLIGDKFHPIVTTLITVSVLSIWIVIVRYLDKKIIIKNEIIGVD